MRSDIDRSKKLYMVQDRQWFKDFIDYEVEQYVNVREIPTMDNIILDWFNDDEFMQCVYNKDEAYEVQSNNLNDLEVMSLYSLAKNIQNLCSFNLSDIYESKKSSTIKLRIKE